MTYNYDPIELFAKQLHENYRATAKAMGVTGPPAHDHGYVDCGTNRKKYFINRAKMLIKRSNLKDPKTLGQAESALQALCFVNRSKVEGWNTRK